MAGLFSARGFNIDSLAVGETQEPEISRMTVIAKGDDRIVDQIMTLQFIDFGDGKPTRAFVCTQPNAWTYPAKDRSGRLEQIERAQAQLDLVVVVAQGLVRRQAAPDGQEGLVPRDFSDGQPVRSKADLGELAQARVCAKF